MFVFSFVLFVIISSHVNDDDVDDNDFARVLATSQEMALLIRIYDNYSLKEINQSTPGMLFCCIRLMNDIYHQLQTSLLGVVYLVLTRLRISVDLRDIKVAYELLMAVKGDTCKPRRPGQILT